MPPGRSSGMTPLPVRILSTPIPRRAMGGVTSQYDPLAFSSADLCLDPLPQHLRPARPAARLGPEGDGQKTGEGEGRKKPCQVDAIVHRPIFVCTLSEAATSASLIFTASSIPPTMAELAFWSACCIAVWMLYWRCLSTM